MIQLQLKAKHFYYIAWAIQDKPLRQFASLLSRIKNAITDTTDDNLLFSVEVSITDLISIYSILANLSEGISSNINGEMNALITPQIQSGVISEIQNGIVSDADGNLPDNAIYQKIAQKIAEIKSGNINVMAIQIGMGKNIIQSL